MVKGWAGGRPKPKRTEIRQKNFRDLRTVLPKGVSESAGAHRLLQCVLDVLGLLAAGACYRRHNHLRL